jgi:23S rRNA pseudouridine1911/1915/1917 synthase
VDEPAPPPSRPRPPAVAVLHADEHLLIIDKPPGFVSIGGRPGEPNVPDLLRDRRLVPADEAFRVVHRLDRDASGVLVYARTLEAQRRLTEAFAERRVEKVYLALVQGYVTEDGEIDLPLAVDKSGNRAEVARQTGKPAVTRYHIRERVAGHTLLECRPLTGRFHQIRVHLAAVGHPLAVDPLYGGGTAVRLSEYKPDYHTSRRREERPLIERLTLHAARITFEHPADSGPVTFESPLPKDFRATVNQLGRI